MSCTTPGVGRGFERLVCVYVWGKGKASCPLAGPPSAPSAPGRAPVGPWPGPAGSPGSALFPAPPGPSRIAPALSRPSGGARRGPCGRAPCSLRLACLLAPQNTILALCLLRGRTLDPPGKRSRTLRDHKIVVTILC